MLEKNLGIKILKKKIRNKNVEKKNVGKKFRKKKKFGKFNEMFGKTRKYLVHSIIRVVERFRVL